MDMTPSPSQSEKRPWYWPFGRLDYRQIRHRSKVAVDSEDLGLDHKVSKSPNTPFTLNLVPYLPRRLATRVKQNKQEWIAGVFICGVGATIVLFLNIILTSVAVSKAYLEAKDPDLNSALLYYGKCSTSKNWKRGLHVVINVLSTIMLGASNYCMQCLCSPSRENVDAAHAQYRWLNIGVPSMNNLHFVSWKRCILWTFLLVSSLPIHFIYNSAIFSALGTNEYPVFLAPEDLDFQNPPKDDCFQDIFGKTTADFFSQATNFERLDYTDCIKRHAADFVTDRGILILFTKNLTVSNESLRWVGWGNSRYDFPYSPFEWMCADLKMHTELYASCSQGHRKNLTVMFLPLSYPLFNATTPLSTTTISSANHFNGDTYSDTTDLHNFMKSYPEEEELQQYLNDPNNWKNSSWAEKVTIQSTGAECAKDSVDPDSPILSDSTPLPVDHCWSEKIEEKCQLLFSLPICLAVICCNAVKVICMFLAAYDSKREILLTVGDAISSFLSNPEDTKESRSWPRSLNKGQLSANQSAQTLHKKKRWMKSVSFFNWVGTIMLCLVLLSISGFYLTRGMGTLYETYSHISFSTLWKLGFGNATSSTLIDFYDKTGNYPQVISMVLLANLPQVLGSIAYFLFNKLLTNTLVTAEYNDYAMHCKPLRVSWPKGLQRSTYYLSLPYRYSLPLLVAHTALHWLISQSLFLVEVILHDIDGELLPNGRLVTCGFSPIAIIFGITLSCVMICTLLGLGLKHFKTRMPLAGCRSITISTACHPPPGGNDALKPIMWGEIPQEQLDPEAVSEEEPLRSTSSLGTKSHSSDGDKGQYSNKRQGNEGQAQSLTKENGSIRGEDGTGYEPHYSFSSLEVITLKS